MPDRPPLHGNDDESGSPAQQHAQSRARFLASRTSHRIWLLGLLIYVTLLGTYTVPLWDQVRRDRTREVIRGTAPVQDLYRRLDRRADRLSQPEGATTVYQRDILAVAARLNSANEAFRSREVGTGSALNRKRRALQDTVASLQRELDAILMDRPIIGVRGDSTRSDTTHYFARNPLVDVPVRGYLHSNGSVWTAQIEPGTPMLRTERLFFYSGMWFVLVLTVAFSISARTLVPVPEAADPRAGPRNLPPLRTADAPANGTALVARETGSAAQETLQLLLSRVSRAALQESSDVSQRALLLLAAGISMAVLGAGVFYWAVPDTRIQAAPPFSADFWLRIIRATGILLFLESIAFFLLRQYRTATKDSQTFFRLHVRRTNYEAAERVLSSKGVSDTELLLALSLINDDVERTVDGVREPSPPHNGADTPVASVLRSLVERIPAGRVSLTASENNTPAVPGRNGSG